MTTPNDGPDMVTMEELADDCRRLLMETELLTAALEAVTAENATLREELQDALSTQAVYKGHALEARSSLAEAQKDSARLDRAFRMLDRLVAAGVGAVEVGQTENDGRPGIFFPQSEKASGMGDTVKEALLDALDSTTAVRSGRKEADNDR